MKNPTPQSVVDLRFEVQTNLNMGITAAQDYCAALVHTQRRVWQQWERGERKMHPAFWELANLKGLGPYRPKRLHYTVPVTKQS